jgi:hypothetical protein
MQDSNRARTACASAAVLAAPPNGHSQARAPGHAGAARGDMSVARAGHQATVLKTGEVPISGDAGKGENFQSSCELI